jgi:hypothetical protein
MLSTRNLYKTCCTEEIFKACFGFSVQVMAHVKKFTAFYGTAMFIIMFTRAHHLSLSLAGPVQSMPYHVRLGLTSTLFPSSFPTKTLYASLLSPHMCHMPCPSRPSLFVHPSNTWWGLQIIKLHTVQFSTVFRHFLPYRPKYHPEHCSQTHSVCVLPSIWQTKFHTHIRQEAELFYIF